MQVKYLKSISGWSAICESKKFVEHIPGTLIPLLELHYCFMFQNVDFPYPYGIVSFQKI
jgi:hypothetical protein